MAQTGIDLVCGPEGEACVCYYNGQEFVQQVEIPTFDGDFLSCWLEAAPHMPIGVVTEESIISAPVGPVLPIGYNCSVPQVSGVDHAQFSS